MVLVKAEYKGELRCSVKHEPSGAVIETSAPADNMGKGDQFSPTDLVAAALASCIGTILGIYAQRKGLKLEGMRIDVRKEMAAEGPRRIGKLPVEIWIPVALTEEHRIALENAAYTCPVHRSLHPDIESPILIHWQ